VAASEGKRLGGQVGPGQRAVRGGGEPLAHRGALVRVEVRAAARRDQAGHPVGGQLHHQGAADVHGEDFAAVAQRRAAEAAAAPRRGHSFGVVELGDQILEARR
jgi:hypothetical protein